MHRATVSVALLLTAVGCARPPPARPAGPPCYAPPGTPCGAASSPPGYPPRPHPGVPPPPATNVGSAVTPFGVILQLPPLPAELPPLPTLTDWIQAFPWPGAPPRPQPPAQPPPPAPPPVPPPSGPPVAGGWHGWETEVLRLTNERRAQGAVCGDRPFGPAGPLAPHPALHQSSRNHSFDMAARGYFDHRTPEGVGPGDRARSAGYAGTFVGENIAAGQTSPAEVVQGWMDSPGHCLNIMEPDYRFLGVGYVAANDSYGHYWTQNFGG